MNRRIRSIPFPMDHWKGIGWRKSPTLHANALTLEAYVTDRWTKNPINTVYFDNVVFARSYIGPASPKDGAGKPVTPRAAPPPPGGRPLQAVSPSPGRP